MGATYDSKPSVSDDHYLVNEGNSYKKAVLSNISEAVSLMRKAITELGKLQGLGQEMMIDRLAKEIAAYETIYGIISKL